MTTAEIEAAIEKAFPWPQFAVVWQVRDRAGFEATRTGDALVMGLWPSRGLTLHGLEVKADRRDWLRELKRPEKAEPIALYCDQFSVVAPVGIVKVEEVPLGWGLLEVTEKGALKCAKVGNTATRDEAKPITRSFLAALLKAAARPAQSLTAKETQEAFDRGVQYQRDLGEKFVDRHKEQAENLLKRIERFEAASGVSIDHYDCERVGEAVKAILRTEYDSRSLRRIADSMVSHANNVVKAVEEIEAAMRPKGGA